MLAVAPLFLCPFFGDGVIATVLLWLSLLTWPWMVFEPSKHVDEHVGEARRRVAKAMLHDPCFWALLVLVAFTAFRACNTGIAFRYDAEASSWYVSSAKFPILPGVVGAAGDLPFAASVAMFVLLQSCRHCLGRAARKVFLLTASSLSGLAAIVTLIAIHEGCASAFAQLLSADAICHSFSGFAFGLYLLVGMVALVAMSDYHAGTACLGLFSIAGNCAGLFAFAPAYLAVALLAGSVLGLIYAATYGCVKLRGSSGFRMLAIAFILIAAAGGLAYVTLPKEAMELTLAPYLELKFFPARFWEMREVLTAISIKSWLSNLWIGTGLGSFPFDVRFGAAEADWAVLPSDGSTLAYGWLLLLAERGIAGMVFFVLPLGFLLFTYGRRMVGGIMQKEMPHPECVIAPVALAVFVAAGFYDCSPLRVEVVMALGALLAVSAAAFPAVKRGENG